MLANIRTTTLIVVSALSAVAASQPAAAASAENIHSQVVSYHDLNLKSDQGIAQLNQRVRSALNQVCGQADVRDLKGRGAVLACRKTAMARTDADVQLAVAAARGDQQLAQNLSTPSIKVDAH